MSENKKVKLSSHQVVADGKIIGSFLGREFHEWWSKRILRIEKDILNAHKRKDWQKVREHKKLLAEKHAYLISNLLGNPKMFDTSERGR